METVITHCKIAPTLAWCAKCSLFSTDIVATSSAFGQIEQSLIYKYKDVGCFSSSQVHYSLHRNTEKKSVVSLSLIISQSEWEKQKEGHDGRGCFHRYGEISLRVPMVWASLQLIWLHKANMLLCMLLRELPHLHSDHPIHLFHINTLLCCFQTNKTNVVTSKM